MTEDVRLGPSIKPANLAQGPRDADRVFSRPCAPVVRGKQMARVRVNRTMTTLLVAALLSSTSMALAHVDLDGNLPATADDATAARQRLGPMLARGGNPLRLFSHHNESSSNSDRYEQHCAKTRARQ